MLFSNWTRYPVSERNFRVGYNSIYADGAAINPNEFRFLPLLFVILAISVRLAPEHIAGDERTRKLTSSRYYWCCESFFAAFFVKILVAKLLRGLARRSLLIAAAIHTDCLEVVLTRLLVRFRRPAVLSISDTRNLVVAERPLSFVRSEDDRMLESAGSCCADRSGLGFASGLRRPGERALRTHWFGLLRHSV